MPRLQKGEHSSLNVTQKAQHRIYAGLGWDPGGHTGLVGKLREMFGLRKPWHDLDLSCMLFDKDKKIIGHVSTEPGHNSTQKGRIYHSGDSAEGFGDGDDEQISVELLKLDPAIHTILFFATIKSGHVFGEIDSPEIRLADGYSNHNFLQLDLKHPEGKDKPTFLFASIYRTGPESWNVHNISTYLDTTNVEQMNGNLSALLERR